MITQKIEIRLAYHLRSKHLGREVTLDFIFPKEFHSALPVMFMNDGQDWGKLNMAAIMEQHLRQGGRPFLFVAIHSNQHRPSEYGVSHVADYANRGDRATDYKNFVVEELIPYLQVAYNVKAERYFVGFSLGGLSALDITWEHPEFFSKVGVFSGSFWWRSKALGKGYRNTRDRIIHQKVKEGSYKDHLKFWFQCGTMDENMDRNKNGIIDSIDDTLDLIKVLKAKGYKIPQDIYYLEYADGEHNFETWKKLMPNFVTWALE